ncbi:MAG: dienelactone hydrolase family protein [Hyphomicrobiales bacterium]
MLRFASFSAAFFVLVFAITYYVLLVLQSGEPFSLPTFQTQGTSEVVAPSTQKIVPAVKTAESTAKKSVEAATENIIEPSVEIVESSGRVLVEELSPSPQPSGNYSGYTEPVGKFKKHKFRQGFTRRTYHTYLGKSATAHTPHQTVVLLHGSGRTGVSLLDMWKETADLYDLYLVAPDSYHSKGWSTITTQRDFFQGLIDHADEEARIDKEEVYLFGHSAGGRLATKLAAKQSLPFRAIATHAGFEGTGSLGEIELGLPKQIPISFYLGDDDHIFKVDAAEATANKFANAGHDISLFVIPGHTHWYYSIGPELNKLIWADISRK